MSTSTEVSRVTISGAKSAAGWAAGKYRAESLRRREIRSKALPTLKAARVNLRVARIADPQGVKASTHVAHQLVREARRACPYPACGWAASWLAGIGFGAYIAAPMVPTVAWAGIAAAVVIAVVGSVAWGVKRSKREPHGLVPTVEEKRLLERLAPEHWAKHAEARGLDGTITSRPVLGESGITCAVRLDGKWTAGKFRDSADHVRALLGAKTGTRMEIGAGKAGNWAQIVIRTRSAADGDDLLWTPEKRTFGVDTVTGKQVTIPLGERMLIAGMSGAGKSIASRPLLYDASTGDTNALAIIDLKKVEGRLWDHRARVASTPEDVVALVAELVAEQTYRLDILPKGQDKWDPTPDHPSITVCVDEGAEVMTAAKDALEGLESLARMGRAACIDVWWMTQKPSIGDGIPKQIAPQLSTRICLAVSTPTEARVVLGEDAQAKGWRAEDLPMPGVALVRDGKRKPNPVRVRYMDKKVVIGLPDRPIWGRVIPAMFRKPPVDPPAGTPTAQDRILSLVKERPLSQGEIAEQAQVSKGTVSKLVSRLESLGLVVRDGGIVRAV